jgi:hypothetical protein
VEIIPHLVEKINKGFLVSEVLSKKEFNQILTTHQILKIP